MSIVNNTPANQEQIYTTAELLVLALRWKGCLISQSYSLKSKDNYSFMRSCLVVYHKWLRIQSQSYHTKRLSTCQISNDVTWVVNDPQVLPACVLVPVCSKKLPDHSCKVHHKLSPEMFSKLFTACAEGSRNDTAKASDKSSFGYCLLNKY